MFNSFNDVLIGISIISLIGSSVLIAYIIYYKKSHSSH